jgi:hypothetical protein
LWSNGIPVILMSGDALQFCRSRTKIKAGSVAQVVEWEALSSNFISQKSKDHNFLRLFVSLSSLPTRSPAVPASYTVATGGGHLGSSDL